MNKNPIILLAVVLLVVFSLAIWLKNKNNQSPNLAINGASVINAITTSESSYDFSAISMKNGLVSHNFKMKNPTDQDINIVGIETSCMCTTAYLKVETGERGPFGMPGHGGPAATRISEVIKAGQSFDLKVVYDPNAHGPAGVGEIERSVYVTESSGATLTLGIKALVTP